MLLYQILLSNNTKVKPLWLKSNIFLDNDSMAIVSGELAISNVTYTTNRKIEKKQHSNKQLKQARENKCCKT